MTNISINPDDTKMFPDAIYFSHNQEYATRCKIIEMANRVYVVKIPMIDIESLDISQDGSDSNRNKYSQNYNEKPFYDDKQESSEIDDNIPGLELVEEMEFEELQDR